MSVYARRKARKEHRCTFCGEVIPKGSLYEDVTLTPWSHADNEGYGQWKLHTDCLKFWNDGYGDGSDFVWYEEVGEFKESLAVWKKNREAVNDEIKESHKQDW